MLQVVVNEHMQSQGGCLNGMKKTEEHQAQGCEALLEIILHISLSSGKWEIRFQVRLRSQRSISWRGANGHCAVVLPSES